MVIEDMDLINCAYVYMYVHKCMNAAVIVYCVDWRTVH